MRRRQLKRLWARLSRLAAMNVKREEMLMKLGAARSGADRMASGRSRARQGERRADLLLNRQKLQIARRREGRYLLRTNLTDKDPAVLWQYYVQLVAVEGAFKNLKGAWRSARSSITTKAESKPISSSPSSPMPCRSADAPAPRARAGTDRAQRAGKVRSRPG